MKTMILGIDVVYLHAFKAKDLSDWYSEILGLELKFNSSDNSWQEYRFRENPPTRFAIESVGMNPSEVEKQNIMISFRVDDVKTMVRNLEEKGIEFLGSPKIKKEGFSIFATLQDPGGNWIQLSQRVDE